MTAPDPPSPQDADPALDTDAADAAHNEAADETRMQHRADELLPEETAVGSEAPDAQARAILEESHERMDRHSPPAAD